jgi:myo-inositol-1(or 4)-monophosphatase
MAGRLLATNGHLHGAISHTLGQIKPLALPSLASV